MKKPLKTFVTIATALTLVLGNVVAVSAAPYYDLGTGKVYTAETLRPGNPEREELKDLDPEKVGVAIGEKVYSFKNLENKLAEVFAEGGIEEVQNFFTNPENLEEFEAELPSEEELKVVEVSAINNTHVIVNFKEIEEAEAAYVVEVKNPSGAVVPVKPVDLSVGDTEVAFEFVTSLPGGVTDIPAGVWTVNGTEYDYAAFLAVRAINNAKGKTQLDILNALKSPYFENVIDENIQAYETLLNAATADFETVAEIQEKIIDKGNTNVEANKNVKEIIETAAAGNQIKLLSLLKENGFERIIDSNVADSLTLPSTPTGYATSIGALVVGTNDADDVQAAIDNDNLAFAQAYADESGTDTSFVSESRLKLTRAVYNTALAQVNNLDVETQKTQKEGMLEDLVITDLLIKLNEAQTNAAMGTALNNLAAASTSLDADDLFAVNNSAYRTAIQEDVVGAKNAVDKVASLVETANAEELYAVTDAFITAVGTGVVGDYDATKEADRAKFLNDLKAIDARVLDSVFDYADIDEQLAGAYITAIQINLADTASGTIAPAHTTAGTTKDKTNTEATVTAIDTVLGTATTGAETAALAAVASAADANALYEALTAPVLGLKDVVVGNKATYWNDATYIKSQNGSVDALQAAVKTANGLATFNSATTASDAAKGLATIAINTATPVTDYIDFPSAGRVDIAELMLDIRPSAGFATSTALIAELGADDTATTATSGNFKTGSTDSALKVYTDVLGTINAAGPDTPSISGLVTALGDLNYDVFDDLDALEKAEVAEEMLANWEMTTGTPVVQVDFTTWSAVKAAVDAAIAAIQ